MCTHACTGPGGSTACCAGAVLEAGKSCNTNNAPCVVHVPPFPHYDEYVAYKTQHEAELASSKDVEWISKATGAGTRIVYGRSADGSRVPDFSTVGYRRGEAPLPKPATIPALVTLASSSKSNGGGGGGDDDDTARIQAALDAAGAQPINADTGFRGAVVLGPGTFRIKSTLLLRHSGVVLRGAGSSKTTLLGTARRQYTLVQVKGQGVPGVAPSASLADGRVVGPAVPVGATSLLVAKHAAFEAGQVVIVAVPVQDPTLVETLRMDRICKDAPSDRQWIKGFQSCNSCPITSQPANAGQAVRGSLLFERTVTRVVPGAAPGTAGVLHFDSCVPMAIRHEHGGGWVFPTVQGVQGALPYGAREPSGRIAQVGVEALALDGEYIVGKEDSDEQHAWTAVAVDNAEHAFVREIACRHMGYACVNVQRGAMYVTVEDAASAEPVSRIEGGRRYSFNNDGSLVLMQRLRTDKGRHDFVSGSRVAGPNVWRDSVSTNGFSDIGPHHRFSAGQLYEGIRASGKAAGWFSVQNRAYYGSGHGWTGTAIVFFNCVSVCDSAATNPGACTRAFVVDSPANASGINWGIGNVADSATPKKLFRSGFTGTAFGLTTPCKDDMSDAPPKRSSVTLALAAFGGQHERFGAGGHWQSKGTHLAAIPSLYRQQLYERTNPAPAPVGTAATRAAVTKGGAGTATTAAAGTTGAIGAAGNGPAATAPGGGSGSTFSAVATGTAATPTLGSGGSTGTNTTAATNPPLVGGEAAGSLQNGGGDSTHTPGSTGADSGGNSGLVAGVVVACLVGLAGAAALVVYFVHVRAKRAGGGKPRSNTTPKGLASKPKPFASLSSFGPAGAAGAQLDASSDANGKPANVSGAGSAGVDISPEAFNGFGNS